MLKDYKNIDSILVSTEPTRGDRLDDKDLLVLKYENTTPTFDITKGEVVEFHVYDIDGNYIVSNHDAQYKKEKPKSSVSDSTIRSYYFDIHQAVRGLGLLSGEYKFTLNFYRSIIGSFDGIKLALTEISPSRKEIRLKPVDDFSRYAPGFDLLNDINDVDFLVNFGNDLTATAVNWMVDTDTDTEATIVIRLYDTLSSDIELGDECWVVDEVSTPYIDNIKVVGAPVPVLQNTIQGPNFDVITDYRLKTETDFKTWNQLLGSGVSTSQQLIDNYFSGSLSGIKLNIDYCEFENFVHFSSAEERIKNFKYKIELIEQYDSRIAELAAMTGTTGSNLQVTTEKKNNIISGFDDFENYLYFQSGSGTFTFGSCSLHPWPKQPGELVTSLTWQQIQQQWQNATSTWVQGGLVQTVPGFKPYTLYSSTSTQVKDWYNSAIASASLYDTNNDSALIKTIPEHIRTDSDNEQYDVFVNMMGHHFDILWSYITHLNKTITREEHFKEGMSNDLLFNVAKSMGWNLSLGNNTTDLWDYTLGTKQDGTTQQTGSMESKPKGDVTKEIWRRIVNNLPHLLKTKGTARSVKALLACYGIPQTLLSIREYGGPKLPISEKKPVYIKDDFSYALRVTPGQYISAPWLPVKTGSYKTPDTLELRFRTKDQLKESVSGQTIFQAGFGPRPEWYVTVIPSGSSQRGNLNFYLSGSAGYKSCSIDNEYLFDGNWAGLMVRRNTSTDITGSSNSYTMFVKKHKYGKLTTDASASIDIDGGTEYSYNHSWKSPDLVGSVAMPKIHFGYGDNPTGIGHFSGSFQELRYWASPLDEEDFANHITSPSAYDGNSVSSSFQQLRFRIPLRQKFDLSTTSSFISQHPDQTILEFEGGMTTSASFVNFASESCFYGIDETYYIENPSLGGNNIWSEKVRIEGSALTGFLNPDTRKEKSTYDTAPVDSPRLGIYFSPQNSINEDIFNQLGFFEIDDYIGAPDNVYKDDYPDLKSLAYNYWKKYSDKNNFNEYLRLIYQYDMSLFKQLEQLLPSRVKKLDGVLVEPNILERSKDRVIEQMDWEEPFYSMSLDQSDMNPNPTASYIMNDASMSLYPANNILGSYDTLPSAEVSLSLAVNPSQYKFNELITVNKLYNTGVVYPSSVYTRTFTASFDSGDLQPSKNAWSNTEDITGSVEPIAWGKATAYTTLDNPRPTGSLGGSTAVITPMIAVHDYGFNIPPNAYIHGIEAHIHRTQVVTGSMLSTDTGFCKDWGVWLDTDVSSSDIVYENKAKSSQWAESVHDGSAIYYSPETASYGNDSQLWGRRWTPATINTGSFGLKFVVQGRAGIQPYYSRMALVESVGLKIYYSIRSVTTASNPYWEYNPIQPVITASRLSVNTYNSDTPYTYYNTDWSVAGTASVSQSTSDHIPWGSVGSTVGVSDNNFASSSVSMSFNTGLQPSQSSVLVGSNFGHNIPGGAVITGIMARVKRKADNVEPDPGNLPGGRGYYTGISDYLVKVNNATGSSGKWSSVGNKANIAVYTPGNATGVSITTTFPATSSNALQGMVSQSDPAALHDFAASKFSWSFNGSVPIKTGGTNVSHICSLYDNTSGATGNYAQFTPVDVQHFQFKTNNRFNYTTPFVVRDLGFQIGSAGASPPYSDSGSWTIQGIKIDVKRGAFDNSRGGAFDAPYNSAVYDGYIEDPSTGDLAGVFPFTGSGTNTYPQQALGWGLAKGNRQRYTDAWSRVSRTTMWTGMSSVTHIWSGFETKTYPTESSKQTSWNWGHDWTGHEINSSSFAVALRPAYEYQNFLHLPAPYTCSALIDTVAVTVYAYSSSINPSSPEVSGSVTNTWLTQSQYATFGGYNDLWGTTWSIDDVNSSNFSLQYQANFPTGSVNTGSIDSIETKIFYKTTSSRQLSDTQEFLPQGTANSRYEGSKVTSADFNIDSPDTVDGGPVVEIIKANPNKFIVTPQGASGSIKVL